MIKVQLGLSLRIQTAHLHTSTLVHLLKIFSEVGHVVISTDDNGGGCIAADVTCQASQALLSRASHTNQQRMSTADANFSEISSGKAHV